MTRIAPSLLFVMLVLLCGFVASAQPNDGDLIVCGNVWAVAVDPGTGAVSTLYKSFHYTGQGYWRQLLGSVRMAEDNRGLVVAINQGYADHGGTSETGYLFRIDPKRRSASTLSRFLGGAGMSLDYDGRWIAAGEDYSYSRTYGITSYASAFAGVTGRGATNYAASSSTIVSPGFGHPVIDRDPGGSTYVFSGFGNLLRADRTGIRSTLTRKTGTVDALGLNDMTGEYVALVGRRSIYTVDKAGNLRSSLGLSSATHAMSVNGDGTAWMLNGNGVGRIDLGTGSRIQTTKFAGAPSSLVTYGYDHGITVYGSRRLVCNGSGAPGTKVGVRLLSRRAGDGGKAYALACSTARRPGLRLSTGEWLNLDLTDGLFHVSAANLLPAVFQSFRGITDKLGEATAWVNIPASFPKNTGITIFVAGVIYDSGGVRTVTNTHWFALN